MFYSRSTFHGSRSKLKMEGNVGQNQAVPAVPPAQPPVIPAPPGPVMPAHTGRARDPPTWYEGQAYEKWKKELAVWQLLKAATPLEEGPLVYRVLTGEAKDAVDELATEEIGSPTGLKQILDKLDEHYEIDKNQKICVVLETFEKYKRPPSMLIANFLLEFEKLYAKLVKYQCNYPDAVLAYKVLVAANLSPEHERLCKATVNTETWSYKSMKAQIKKIFCDFSTIKSDVPDRAIKLEPTLYTNSSNVVQRRDVLDDYSEGDLGEDEYTDDEMGVRHGYYHREAPRRTYYTGNEECDVYYGRNRITNFNRSNFRKTSQSHSNNNPPIQRQQGNYFRPQTQGKRYININIKKLRDSYNNDPNVPNPKDERGMHTTCRKCHSIYHWLQDCPHASTSATNNSKSNVYYSSDPTEEVYISLFQASVPASVDEVTRLVGETHNHAVIDTGCPTPVCGEQWYKCYLDSMTEEEKSSLKIESSEAMFRFGDSPSVKSIHKVYLPVTICDKEMFLATDVVESDIPLLLSKDVLIKSKANLDFGTETIKIYEKRQPMICTTSGHHAIPIRPHGKEITSNIIMHTVKDNKDDLATAKKLHQQFGHPVAHRLIKLIKDSGNDNDNLLKAVEDVTNNCDTCKRYKKTAPRPVVTFPLATIFNETVAMDLKIFENNSIYFLHLIDHATRFSAAGVIRNKRAETIVKKLFEIWISIYGCPQTILSDNGGEFVNKLFTDMCENLNVRFITTAAESPWSNGLVERHNGLIGDAVSKIMEDVDCSVDIALCWAINAKNSLQNIYGFSPYQLVFGRNPNLPSVLTDKLPALEGVTSSDIISDQLNALHAARQHIIKLESSEKLRRALRSQVRKHHEIKFLPGEKVFYKQEGVKRWGGPGDVIGHIGSKVLIKIPTGHISVHSSRVILTSEAEQNRNLADVNEDQDDALTDEVNLPQENQTENVSEEFDINDHFPQDNPIRIQDTINEENVIETVNRHDEGDPMEIPQTNDDLSEENALNRDDSDLANEVITENVHPPTVKNKVSSINVPKNNQCVEYKTHESDEWIRCRILGRAGKAGGKYEHWRNVENLDDHSESCIDWKEEVQEWKLLSNNVLLTDPKSRGYEAAKSTELEKWAKMGVYEVVEDEGQDYVTVKWVLSEKIIEGKKTEKARLVARGYEDNTDGVATDSPCINKESLRIAFMIIASNNWEIHSLDIRAAFLQGQVIDREVYLKPPKEANMKGKLWKLVQCVYGLNDASRKFYFKVKEELSKAGCKCSKLDQSIFMYYDPNLQGFIMSHVDDFLWAGSNKFKVSVIQKIREKFKISSENSNYFKYIGWQIQQCPDGIYISQKDYAQDDLEIAKISGPSGRSATDPITKEEKESLRSVIGKLNWLAGQTRPDLSFDVCYLSSSLKLEEFGLISFANKIVKKAKLYDVALFFPKMDLSDLAVYTYADASLGNLCDGGSQEGVFTEIRSGNLSCPVDWQSKRIRRTAKNTLAAETIAMVDAIDTAIYIKNLLKELLQTDVDIPVYCLTDNYSLFQTAHATTSIGERRLRIELAIIREAVKNGDIILKWVSSKDQYADCLTKRGADSQKLLSRISNV